MDKTSIYLNSQDKEHCEQVISEIFGRRATVKKSFAGCSNILYLISLEDSKVDSLNQKEVNMVLRFFTYSKFKCHGNFEQEVLLRLMPESEGNIIVLFANATLIPYIHGKCPICNDSELVSSSNMQKIAQKMAEIHLLNLDFNLYNKLTCQTIGIKVPSQLSKNSSELIHGSYLSVMAEHKDIMDLYNWENFDSNIISIINDEMPRNTKNNDIETNSGSKVSNMIIWNCLCHMDIHSENIIQSDFQANHIDFIDWEYSAIAWNFLDISNFFAEATGITANITDYPLVEKRKQFYQYYFNRVFQEKTGYEITNEFLDLCDKICMAFVPITFGFWYMWADKREELTTYCKNRKKVFDYFSKKTLDIYENETNKNENPLFKIVNYIDEYVKHYENI